MSDDELIRQIEERRKDAAFMERLESSIKRNKHILDRLAEPEPIIHVMCGRPVLPGVIHDCHAPPADGGTP